MIDGADHLYQRIAASIVDAIDEQWSEAQLTVLCYSDSSDYEGDYVASGGHLRSFEVSMECTRAVRELRRKFKDSGKPVWGQMTFRLSPDGHFKLAWGYDNCDENGNTVWDESAWHKRQEDRRIRLGGTP